MRIPIHVCPSKMATSTRHAVKLESHLYVAYFPLFSTATCPTSLPPPISYCAGYIERHDNKSTILFSFILLEVGIS